MDDQAKIKHSKRILQKENYVRKQVKIAKVNKIPANDTRYELLRNIPPINYDPADEVAFVYMAINYDKDYFLTSTYKEGHAEKQLQIFLYSDENFIQQIEGHVIDF